MASLPFDVLFEIFSRLHGQKDKAALKNSSEASLILANMARGRALTHITFLGLDHILEFFALARAPRSTIRFPVRCDSIVLKNTETVDEANLSVICDLLAGGIQVNRTLGVHVTAGGIPPSVAPISALWGAALRQLSIRGGTHSPFLFFQFLASFPRLESVGLRGVQFDEAGPTGPQHTFPPSVRQLSLARCATLWTFFKLRVLPGGGFNNVHDLYIQELFFSGEPGVEDMRDCFRQLPAVNNLILDPVHEDDLRPNFNRGQYDIGRRCWEATFLQMRSLALLRLNCANLPRSFAPLYVGWYALQLALQRLPVQTAVEVYAPHSLELSAPGACEKHLDASGCSTLPSGVADRSNLVIRGFPGKMPGANRIVKVCGYPVTFMRTDWEEALGARLDGL